MGEQPGQQAAPGPEQSVGRDSGLENNPLSVWRGWKGLFFGNPENKGNEQGELTRFSAALADDWNLRRCLARISPGGAVLQPSEAKQEVEETGARRN